MIPLASAMWRKSQDFMIMRWSEEICKMSSTGLQASEWNERASEVEVAASDMAI